MKDTWAIEIEITKDTCAKNIQGEIIKHLNRCPFTLHSHGPSLMPQTHPYQIFLKYIASISKHLAHKNQSVQFFFNKASQAFFFPCASHPSPGFSGVYDPDLSILRSAGYLYVWQELAAVDRRPTRHVKYLHTPTPDNVTAHYEKVVMNCSWIDSWPTNTCTCSHTKERINSYALVIVSTG